MGARAREREHSSCRRGERFKGSDGQLSNGTSRCQDDDVRAPANPLCQGGDERRREQMEIKMRVSRGRRIRTGAGVREAGRRKRIRHPKSGEEWRSELGFTCADLVRSQKRVGVSAFF